MADAFSWERVLRERGMLEEPHDESVEPEVTVPDQPPVLIISDRSAQSTSMGSIADSGEPEDVAGTGHVTGEPETILPLPTTEEPLIETSAEIAPPMIQEQAEPVAPDFGATPVIGSDGGPVAVPFGPPEYAGPPAPEFRENEAEEPSEIDAPATISVAESEAIVLVEENSEVVNDGPMESHSGEVANDAGAMMEPADSPASSESEPEQPWMVIKTADGDAETKGPAEVTVVLEDSTDLPERSPSPILPKPVAPRLMSDRQESQVLSQLVTADQMKQAKARQKETKEPLPAILVSLRFTSEKRILQAYAHQLGVSPWHLEADHPSDEALACLTCEACREYVMLPVEKRGDLLLVAMANPSDVAAIEAARNLSGLRVEPVLALHGRVLSAIESAYNKREAREAKNVDSLVEQAMKDVSAEVQAVRKQERAVLTEADTRPVIGLVNQIVSDAIRMKASDIHLEPRYDRVEIRYRVDGHLLKVREIPAELAPMLVTRIKIMAEVDIVEHRMPQDGRISAILEDGATVDLRVSVLPNIHGPRIVLRILDKSVGLKQLDQLGFDVENLALFRALVKKPYGLFLVTGPTGSGKTTTLYAALNEIKQDSNNVMTCEDPVEYDLEGINQSQVNERVGLTFAHQLRAILRQDPDVVLVGEIRDQETAQTAIRAALTGHMVLSTLHANDAPSAIPRLLDMGLDPYLLSTALIGTMGQRLLRTLCSDCRTRRRPNEDEIRVLAEQFGCLDVDSLWEANGCERCYGTGYLGRMAVHEVLPITDEVGRLVASRASVEELREVAGYYGFQSMQHDALARVLAGDTTLTEATRILFFDTIPRRAESRASHLRAA